MPKPKIALVFDDSLDRADGVQQQLRLMGRWLNKQKWPALYFCSGTDSKKLEGLRVVNLSSSFAVRANQNRLRLPWPISAVKAAAQLSQHQVELVHIMLPFSPWLGGRIVKAALNADLPVIGTFHTYPGGRLQRLGSRLYGSIYRPRLRSLDRLFSVSKATSEAVLSLYGVDTEVMPNFVDVGAFKLANASDKADRRKTIVFVGRLVERKGPSHLLNALGRLHANQQLSNVTVELVGDGPLRAKLQAQVERLRLNDIVNFTGFVSEQDKAKILSRADLAVYPATSGEAFGIVLLEAMAAGTVVLGGDNPGYRSVLTNSKQLINPLDTNSFAARIKLLLTDEKLRLSLIQSQRSTLKQFDYQTVMNNYGEIYTETLALKRKASHT